MQNVYIFQDFQNYHLCLNTKIWLQKLLTSPAIPTNLFLLTSNCMTLISLTERSLVVTECSPGPLPNTMAAEPARIVSCLKTHNFHSSNNREDLCNYNYTCSSPPLIVTPLMRYSLPQLTLYLQMNYHDSLSRQESGAWPCIKIIGSHRTELQTGTISQKIDENFILDCFILLHSLILHSSNFLHCCAVLYLRWPFV